MSLLMAIMQGLKRETRERRHEHGRARKEKGLGMDPWLGARPIRENPCESSSKGRLKTPEDGKRAREREREREESNSKMAVSSLNGWGPSGEVSCRRGDGGGALLGIHGRHKETSHERELRLLCPKMRGHFCERDHILIG